MQNNVEISVIIPFYNESDNVAFLLTALTDYFKENNIGNCEVLFVDDGSTDDSIKQFNNHIDKIIFPASIIKLSKNYGAHAAVKAGVLEAKGKYTMFLPADLQDPLYLIKELHTTIQQGHEIVWAQRKQTENGFFEKLFSTSYARLMQKFVNKDYPDKGFDIVMFDSKIKEVLNKNVEANSSIFLQILSLGFKQKFIEYNKLARKAGSSKWTVSKKVKLLIDSFIAFSYAPIRFVTLIGILFFVLGIAWTCYIIGRALIFDDLDKGWPALISILMLGFGITNISLGIIAEYLWRTLDSSRKRPIFIIDDIITLTNK
ncbi:MAG: glycosyltransferase [Sphingobacteriales bacterium JAD_PAG50586_3]|nr:MAG: glycosyltransferase [Sphingobacteriales bacterium JAD_PAG50586_3]